MRAVLSLVLTVAVVAGVGAAGQTPKLVYPPSDAAADIAKSVAEAAKSGKHVLIDFGADWCPDCRVLGALLEDASVAPFVAANFLVVHVDVGRRDKNADIVAKYNATSGAWIPAVVVLDGAGKTVAVTDDNRRLTRRDTPETILAVLEQWAPKSRRSALATFTEHGVRVDLALEENSTGGAWLAATFAPTAADVHLYAQELPLTGLDGLGRPTRLRLVSGAGLKARGDAVADRPVEQDRIEILKQTFPIYPAGPVTLRVPVERPSRRDLQDAEVSVTYMGCSPKGCLQPVIDRRMVVRVPEKE